MSNRNSTLARSVKYPMFIIENDRKHKYTGLDIVYGPTGFSVWGRVPNSMKYTSGQVFDASGQVFSYKGSDGCPRFTPKTCLVLDSLVVPGIVTKLFEKLWYFGPALTKGEHVNLDEYRARILWAITEYGSNDVAQLRALLARKTDFLSILEGVEWWRYHGGRRDEDGHPH